ncbi:MAG TPA: response regulator transcription factor [Methylomirabilota bacterium]|jgi:DNA-binding NarL/FixJ family response regulator
MSETKRIEVIIVARDEVTRVGLRAVLSVEPDVRVVAEASSNDEAIRHVTRLRPDVVLLDGAGADGNLVEACLVLRAQAPHTHVVAVIDTAAPSCVVNAVRAGANGCIAESSRLDDVRRIVRAVAAGDVAFDPHVTRVLLEHLRREPLDVGNGEAALTPAECRALRLVADGKTNRQIASDLAVSEKTVKNWLAHAFGKLHVTRRAEAAVRFMMPHAAVDAMWAAHVKATGGDRSALGETA